ncbi:MAG: hypothetical protein Q9184_003286 [Pyrenodesmia sp. 2 TL-2023]
MYEPTLTCTTDTDFMFILNGNQTDLLRLIPPAPNVWAVHHENRCHDLGSCGKALQDIGAGLAQYKRFILMNASIRGPFVPHWSEECWSDAYLDKGTDKVKLVGMTCNCLHFAHHVNTMIKTTDAIGLNVLLDPTSNTLAAGPSGHDEAADIEVPITRAIKDAGYKVDFMMQKVQSEKDVAEFCTGSDRNEEGAYDQGKKGFRMNLQPYEMLFFKANRHVNGGLFDHLTTCTDQAGF